MRSFGFWVLIMIALLSAILGSESAFNKDNVVMAINRGEHAKAMNNRKLKEKNFEDDKSLINQDSGSINQEDYPCFDPSPNSEAAIHSGPIEYGTPLMPYIPRSTPPPHLPKHGSP